MPPRKVESPFVGLVPYTEDDARFFFGRERDQRRILSNLFASRLTILYGASGVGKSSVLRAGIVREVRRRIDEARAAKEPPTVAVVYFKDWKGDILASLRAAIGSALLALLEKDCVSDVDNGASLRDLLTAIAARFDGDLLLIFDQFEEYFLYHPGPAPDGFAVEFAEAANQAGLRANFLLSLRDDAVSRLDRFKALIPALFSNYLRLRHLSGQDARDSILKPVECYNALPDDARKYPGQFAVEPPLVDAVIDQVHTGRVLLGQVGQGQVAAAPAIAVETPYLQLVMTRLWQTEVQKGSRALRSATLTELGGAEAIVKGHLESALSGLTAPEKRFCAAIFPHLVTPSGTKIAHTLGNLAKFAKADPATLTPMLASLVDKRILATVAPPDGEPGQLQYEIYHDSLGQAVLAWQDRYEKEQERAARAKEKRSLVVGVLILSVFLVAAVAGLLYARHEARIAKDLRAQVEELDQERINLAAKATQAATKLTDLSSSYSEAVQQHDNQRAVQLSQEIKSAEQAVTRLTGAAALSPAELSKLRGPRGAGMQALLQDRVQQGAGTIAQGLPAGSAPEVQSGPPEEKKPPVAAAPVIEPEKTQPPAPLKAKTLPEIVAAAQAQWMQNRDVGLALAVYAAVKAIEARQPVDLAIEGILRSGASYTPLPDGLQQPQLLAFRPDGKMVAVSSGTTCMLLSVDGSSRTPFGHPLAWKMQWTAEGKYLAFGGHQVDLYDLERKSFAPKPPKDDSGVAAMAAGPYDTVAFAWKGSDEIRFFAPGGMPKQHFTVKDYSGKSRKAQIASLVFWPDGSSLVAGSDMGVLTWYSYPAGTLLRGPIEMPGRSAVDAIAVSANAEYYAVASHAGELFRLPTKRDPGASFAIHAPANSISFHPSGTLAIADSEKATILNGSTPVASYPGSLVSFSPDGRSLAVAEFGQVRLYPGDITSLIAQAKWLHRLDALRDPQCREYLGLEKCPQQ